MSDSEGACLFCKIADGRVKAEVVYEDAQVMAFKDIHPKAPVHVLVIPKAHVANLKEARREHQALLGHLMLQVASVAEQLGLGSGFKTILNTGVDGGQEIYHLHAHLLGGQKMPFLVSDR